MTRFIWKSEYELGNEMIDSQHKLLLDLANALHEEADGDGEDDILKHSFEALLIYTKKHFEDEAAFFAEIGSLELDRHCEDHDLLTAEINALWLDDQLGFADDMKQQLERWVEQRLVPHMMIADQNAFKKATRFVSSR